MSYHATRTARRQLVTRSKLLLLENGAGGQRVARRQQHRYLSASVDGSGGGRRRLRRSVHFVPADNDKFLSKCLSLGADTVVLDLEDSVKDKRAGREKLLSFLRREDNDGRLIERCETTTEVLVRINPLSESGPFGRDAAWREDVDAGLIGGADGFVVPKVESSDELRLLDEIMTEYANGNDSGVVADRADCAVANDAARMVLLPIATETPAAVLNVADIARGPRVCAVTWGCEDLSAALGGLRTRDDATGEYLEVYKHCRTACLLAAKAAGVQAIDGIYQNVRDLDGLEGEARDAMRMGFDGKLTLHPEQVRAVHRAFEPTREELEEAEDVVAMWEEGGEEGEEGEGGKGSLEQRDGRMIDLPHYVRAKKVVARSSAGLGGGGGVRNDVADERNDDATMTTTSVDVDTSGELDEESRGDATTAGIGIIDNDAEEDEAEGEIFPRVYLGKYFEDLRPGLKMRHFLTRTVTESDNVFFTCLTLNPAPIHLDHELSRGNDDALSSSGGGGGGPGNEEERRPGAGKPLFNSMFTLALLVGMSVPESTHGTTVANLGFSEVTFPKPVYPGDTLRAETSILDRRESASRPTQGIVTLQHSAYNQRGEVVCRATRKALMKKRP